MDEWLGISLTQSLPEIQNHYDWDSMERFVSLSLQPSTGQSRETLADEKLWMALPDELWERILALLPVTYVIRARAVCKRWNSIISSNSFLTSCAQASCSKPWYFMYKDYKNDYQNATGVAHDPVAKKWHEFKLPLDTPSGFVASAHGLVCFMDNSNGNKLFVCNPMTRTYKKLPDPAERWSSDYYTVSMTVDRATKVRTTVVARSNQVPGNYSRWYLTIEVHDSASNKWRTKAKTLLHGWRAGENSIICNGMFYCVMHSTAMVGCGEDTIRHGLIMYKLSDGALNVGSVAMPCSFTCVKLMNCKDRLVMVGGIGKPDIIRGIGIWELDSVWRELARMPNKFFRGFGEFDEVFASSGSGDLIYIQSFGSPLLLLYDMGRGSWRWSQRCPLMKKYPLHLFTGFCFEPRLEAWA